MNKRSHRLLRKEALETMRCALAPAGLLLVMASILLLVIASMLSASPQAQTRVASSGVAFVTFGTLGLTSQDQEELGTVPGGISKNGQVAVGGTGEDGDEAFRWTERTGIERLGDLAGGGRRSWAEGANADGSVIVGSSEYAPGRTQAFLWAADGGMGGLGALPGGTTSSASAVTSGGDMVIGQSEYVDRSGAGTQPFLWTQAGGMAGLGSLSPEIKTGEAFALTPDGSVVIGQSGEAGFRWTPADGMRELGPLPNQSSPARFVVPCALSETGHLIAGGAESDRSTPSWEAFIWTEAEGMAPLGDLPGGRFSSIIYSLSADGLIGVGEGSSELGSEAIIWDRERGIRNLKTVLQEQYGLDLREWRLTRAIAISADGQDITGTGLRGGAEEGWRIRIPRDLD